MTDITLRASEKAIVEAEEELLSHIQTQLADVIAQPNQKTDYDHELLALRDQLSEARLEDQAMLVEHMTRLSALRAAKNREYEAPVDPKNPYFGHIQLKDLHQGQPRTREVAIGRRAYIDTQRDIQIVDWRNSPISRIYYCYDEGDDYEETFAKQLQRGHVELRRTLTIHDGRLTRIRTHQAVLMRDHQGEWQPVDETRSRLAGGSGTALRAPSRQLGRQTPDQRLPEITALIDPAQFRLITQMIVAWSSLEAALGPAKRPLHCTESPTYVFRIESDFANKILVITPGEGLKKYVSKVLPSLDVKGVRIRTFPEWASSTAKWLIPSMRKRKLTDETPLGARRLKRHPIMLEFFREWVSEEARTLDDEFERVGGKPLLDAWVKRRTLPPMQRISAVSKWLRGGGMPTGRVDQYQLKRLLEQCRRELGDPVETWAMALTDRQRIKACLKKHQVEHYEWEIDQLVQAVSQQSDEPGDTRDFGDHATGIDGQSVFAGEIRGRLDTDDWAILLYLCQLKYGRLAGPSGRSVSMEHVIVDEAQDPLSAIHQGALLDCAPRCASHTSRGYGPATVSGCWFW